MRYYDDDFVEEIPYLVHCIIQLRKKNNCKMDGFSRRANHHQFHYYSMNTIQTTWKKPTKAKSVQSIVVAERWKQTPPSKNQLVQ